MANDINTISNRLLVKPTAPSTLTPNHSVSDSHRPATDSVHLSLGTLLNQADRVMKQTPVIDEARVRDLANAIAQGRYQPNLGETAEKMLRFESQVAGRSTIVHGD